MKNLYFKSCIFIFCCLVFAGCKENAVPVRTGYVNSGAQLKSYNHAEGSPQVNFYLNGLKVTSAVSPAENIVRGLAFGATFPSTYGYANVPAGNFTMTVIDTITSPTKGTPLTLATREVSMDEGANYTAILVGTPGNYEVLVTKDNLPPVSFSKVFFRFVQTLANAPYNFDVWAVKQAVAATPITPAVAEERIKIASNIAYKSFGEYFEVPLGNYRIEFYKAGSLAAADRYIAFPTTSSTAAITTLALGRVYTIYLRGAWSNPAKTTHIDYWRER